MKYVICANGLLIPELEDAIEGHVRTYNTLVRSRSIDILASRLIREVACKMAKVYGLSIVLRQTIEYKGKEIHCLLLSQAISASPRRVATAINLCLLFRPS